MNTDLDEIVIKLESSIQHYEYVLYETELLIKIIVNLFSKFNNKLIIEILNYNQENDIITEILGYFSLILLSSNTITQVKISLI